MKDMLNRLGNRLRSLHRDEQGASMVEYILVIAAIALPLLAVILIFRNELWSMVSDRWEEIKGDAEIQE